MVHSKQDSIIILNNNLITKSKQGFNYLFEKLFNLFYINHQFSFNKHHMAFKLVLIKSY